MTNPAAPSPARRHPEGVWWLVRVAVLGVSAGMALDHALTALVPWYGPAAPWILGGFSGLAAGAALLSPALSRARERRRAVDEVVVYVREVGDRREG